MAAADRGLLSNRAFLAIWGAQILSQVAANAVTSALIILVAEITHSNTSSSLLILLAVLPAILFGIAGGVIVDRSDRRLVLIVTNALRAAAVVPLLLFGTSLTVSLCRVLPARDAGLIRSQYGVFFGLPIPRASSA